MHFEINDGQTLASCTTALAAMRAFNGQSAPTTPGDELSAQFEADARARWKAEDALDRDLRADLHVKQLQIDDLEAKVTELLAELAAAKKA